MNLQPSDEQLELTRTAAAFLTGVIPMSRTRELMEAGVQPSIPAEAWDSASELGWLMLGLPEDHDGIGCGLADESLVVREIGRSGMAGPFISSVLGARVASFAQDRSLAAQIVAGRRVGLVVPDGTGSIGADGSLIGPVQILDADDGGLALVVTAKFASLVDTASLADVRQVTCFDPTARLVRAVGTGAPPVAMVAASVDAVESRGHVLAAAMLCGIAEWARDTAAEHAKNRIQFDRPIGVHQAIKHPCADMAVGAELAYAQTMFAAVAIDEERPDAQLQALSAYVVASDAAEFATGATLQVLGGMGFTHEHDVHLYLKRATLLSMCFGSSSARLMRLVELPGPD